MPTSRSVAVLALALTSLAVAPLDAQTPPGRILGTVLAHENGKPLQAVSVYLKNTDVQAETDARGRFELRAVAAGRYELVVERLGYEARTAEVEAVAGEILEVSLRMATKPVELPAMDVSVRSSWLTDMGFYDRRDTGGFKGHYITRADIERRNPRAITDLLDDIPGTRVVYSEPGKRSVRFNRQDTGGGGTGPTQRNAFSGAAGCEPDLYIDGHRYRNSSSPMVTTSSQGLSALQFAPKQNKVDDFDAVSIAAVEAVEVYVGARTPIQFSSTCGVILVWTRHGR
jgi:hypothetical protein